MKKLILAAVAAMGLSAFAFEEPTFKTRPVWDLRRDGGAVAERLTREGSLPIGTNVLFEIPHTAIPDHNAFTVYAKVRFTKPGTNPDRALMLLSQQTGDTGWGYELRWHESRGLQSAQRLHWNGAVHGCGWFPNAEANKGPMTNVLMLTARKGTVVTYAGGKVQRRFTGVITPNLEPIRVGGYPPQCDRSPLTNVVELLDLRFYGPDEEYYAKGEAQSAGEGYRGGKGWLIFGPTKETAPRPRLLFYGDSISIGYSSLLRKRLGADTWLYHWNGFVTDADVRKFNGIAFREAAWTVKPDMIVFNNGLHSLHWTTNKVTDAQIEEVTRAIVKNFRMGYPSPRLVWLSTTPRVNRTRDGFDPANEVVLRINRIAEKVMLEEDVDIIDGYSMMLPHLADCRDGYHWNGKCYDLLAAAIEERFRAYLKDRNTPLQPPRTVQPVRLEVGAPRHEVPNTLWGGFLEDFAWGADGGLYPELVLNRGFDIKDEPLLGWRESTTGNGAGRMSVKYARPVNPNTAGYLRIESFGGRAGSLVGMENGGFFGMAVRAGATYDLSLYARGLDGFDGNLVVTLASGGKVLAETKFPASSLKVSPPRTGIDPEPPDWTKLAVELKPTATVTNATLAVRVDKAGIVDVDFVSLYPRDTFKNRRNGLRRDLAEKLAEMKPAFLRFPGGCVLEHRDFRRWLDWKRTVGPLERRECEVGLWSWTQSFGLGYFEYFQLCEDIGMEPLPVLIAGVTCQFRNPSYCPPEGIGYFTQNALDLIEFANGSPETKWGRVRAEMGHPKPFNLKYLALGNENWGDRFLANYLAIEKELKAKHPEVQILSSAGANVDDKNWNLAMKTFEGRSDMILDEHYYKPRWWFYEQASRYDRYDRRGPRIFVGEYACHDRGFALPDGRPSPACGLATALAEAAMMMGYEKNSDVVVMASFAPMFHREGYVKGVKAPEGLADSNNFNGWPVTMIHFDGLRCFGRASYHMQKLFAENRPDVILDLKEGQPWSAHGSGAYSVCGYDRAAKELVLKVLNPAGAARPAEVTLPQAIPATAAKLIVFANEDEWADNTMDEPEKVVPKASVLDCPAGNRLTVPLPPHSLTVLRLPMAECALSKPQPQHGILCLTFDDPNWARWEQNLPLFREYGARASFFPSGPLDDEALAALKRIHDEGHCVGPHTVHHADAPQYFAAKGAESYWTEEVKPQMDAFAKVGIVPKAMAYPNNRHTPETDAFLAAKGGFRRFRAGAPKSWGPNRFGKKHAEANDAFLPAADFGKMTAAPAIGVGEYYKTDIDDLLTALDRAAARNEMIAFYSHDISPEAHGVNMKTEWLRRILARARELKMEFRTLEDPL